MEPPFPDLDELGLRLDTVDRLFIDLLKRRMDLARDVIEEKVRRARNSQLYGSRRKAQPTIFRPAVEKKRLAGIARHACDIGINQNFARMMLYAAIAESCKIQMIKLQKTELTSPRRPNESARLATFKRNLLRLTRAVAKTYDTDYARRFHATAACLDFERIQLAREIDQLPHRGVMVDLGCGTGTLACGMAARFKHVVGYDISPDMVRVARRKAKKLGVANVQFRETDLELGIPEDASSVSLAAMNLGTASDMQNIRSVIGELRRVLRPGGRFFFSFYNRDALIYRWDFMVWEPGLAAMANIHRDYIDVRNGRRTFAIYARAYNTRQVKALFAAHKGLAVRSVTTYPTMSAILPADLFRGNEHVKPAVTEIDRKLSRADSGAYIIVSGVKR